MTAVAFQKKFSVTKGSVAASGGTLTADFAVPTDRVMRVEARAFLSGQTGGAGHVKSASLYAEGVYDNQNGTVAAVTAVSGSTNPSNSSTLTGSRAQASDAAFVGGGSGPPTLILSVSGTNVRATLTNNSDSAQAGEGVILLDVYIAGSA